MQIIAQILQRPQLKTKKNYMKLLEKYTSKNLQLENHVVMAPMTRSRADNDGHVANDLIETY